MLEGDINDFISTRFFQKWILIQNVLLYAYNGKLTFWKIRQTIKLVFKSYLLQIQQVRICMRQELTFIYHKHFSIESLALPLLLSLTPVHKQCADQNLMCPFRFQKTVSYTSVNGAFTNYHRRIIVQYLYNIHHISRLKHFT